MASTDKEFQYVNPVSTDEEDIMAIVKSQHNDADIAVFLCSVVRTQLEISLILKEYPDLSLSSVNTRRACFGKPKNSVLKP